MKRLLFSALALAACGQPVVDPPTTTKLDLNDVSYLYPLPGTLGDRDALLKFSSTGAKGALLTRAFFDQVKAVDDVLTPDQVFSGMRIISARVDPCFPLNKKDEPLKCQKQIRLVAQLIEEDAMTHEVTTRDGTLHLFFDMTDGEWSSVLEGIAALKEIAKTDTDGKPLDTHPTMKAQGLSGAYATRLNTLITEHCGDQNLSRVAFMLAKEDGKNWNFGAFNRKGATLEADLVPRFTDKKEQAVEEHGVEARRNSVMVPEPLNIDLTTILSYTQMQLADDGTLERAAIEALQIENPDKESPQTIDCASCHVASRALTQAVAERGLKLDTLADRYVAPARFDVRRVDQAGTDPFAQRAFGYFHAKTALSQRTINESAVIADKLSPAQK